MKTRTTRTILWITASILLVAAIASVTAAYLWPYEEVPLPRTNRLSDTSHTATISDNRSPQLTQFAKVWALNLQRPLNDSPVRVAPTPKGKHPTPLSVRLAGTVVEPGHSVAMFVNGGKIELKGIGDKIDQAEVLTINLDGVSLRHRGKEIDLKLEKPKKH